MSPWLGECVRLANCVIISPFSVAPDAFPGGTHFIVDNIKLSPLSDEHKARLVEYLDDIQEEVLSKFVRTRPAFLVPYSEVGFLKVVSNPVERNQTALQLHRFALEYFAEVPVPMASFFFDGKNITSHSVDSDGLRFRQTDGIQILSEVWEKQSAYLQFLYANISTAPAAEVVINRICRAFREGPGPDGIIDLAIALESLVEAKLEIKFQFCLFNSLIYSDDPQNRSEIFSLLQSLYDVRSTTVHGSKLGKPGRQKLKVVTENWELLLEIARTNLTYYIEHCRNNSSDDWVNHLKTLSFGGSRIEAGN